MVRVTPISSACWLKGCHTNRDRYLDTTQNTHRIHTIYSNIIAPSERTLTKHDKTRETLQIITDGSKMLRLCHLIVEVLGALLNMGCWDDSHDSKDYEASLIFGHDLPCAPSNTERKTRVPIIHVSKELKRSKQKANHFTPKRNNDRNFIELYIYVTIWGTTQKMKTSETWGGSPSDTQSTDITRVGWGHSSN